MPVAIAIGTDPAAILSAVFPLPETLSEYRFAGLLRDCRTDANPIVANEASAH